MPPGKPTVIEFVEQLEPQNTIRIVVDGLGRDSARRREGGRGELQGAGAGRAVGRDRRAAARLVAAAEPSPASSATCRRHRRRRADDPDRREVVSQQPLVDAERILRDFARRAFRRAVTDEDVKPFLARVKAKLEQEYSFEQAMRVGLKAVLVSPHFLFLREKRAGRHELDDFALASRLSYFLWSSMPDEELLALAEQGKLHEPDDAPRSRSSGCCSDPKAAAFTENFAGQWLGLRAIDATMPDRMLYPEYDDILKVAMVKETLLFFDEVLKNDLSLTNFVASDFTHAQRAAGQALRHPGRRRGWSSARSRCRRTATAAAC